MSVFKSRFLSIIGGIIGSILLIINPDIYLFITDYDLWVKIEIFKVLSKTYP